MNKQQQNSLTVSLPVIPLSVSLSLSLSLSLSQQGYTISFFAEV